MGDGRIGREAVSDLAASSLDAKIARIRDAAASVGRQAPRLQFSVLHLDVTDVTSRTPHRSTWADAVVDHMEALQGSPAAIVGTAVECADKIREYSDRFGIDYWHLCQDTDAASSIITRLH